MTTTRDVAALHLSENEARFMLALMQYGNAALSMDIGATMFARVQLLMAINEMGGIEGVNEVLRRLIKVTSAAFPNTIVMHDGEVL